MPIPGADGYLLDSAGLPEGQRVQRFAEAVRDQLSGLVAFAAGFQGPWGGAGTARSDVVVPATRRYLTAFGGGGFLPAPGGSSIDLRIDGGLVHAVPFFFNVAGQHMFMGVGLAFVELTAGKHAFQVYNGSPGGVVLNSDANDRGFMFGVPA